MIKPVYTANIFEHAYGTNYYILLMTKLSVECHLPDVAESRNTKPHLANIVKQNVFC